MGPLLSVLLLDLCWCRQVRQWLPYVTCRVVAWQMPAILCCRVLCLVQCVVAVWPSVNTFFCWAGVR